MLARTLNPSYADQMVAVALGDKTKTVSADVFHRIHVHSELRNVIYVKLQPSSEHNTAPAEFHSSSWFTYTDLVPAYIIILVIISSAITAGQKLRNKNRWDFARKRHKSDYTKH